jgi:hypothetical protein
LFSSGCANTIIPPEQVNDPRTVYLLDFGRHSSLLIPDTDSAPFMGALTEYAYGDWKWYAEKQTGWTRIVPTLFWPTQGTLGRRTAPLGDPVRISLTEYVNSHEALFESEQLTIMHDFYPDEMFSLDVERERIDALRNELDTRYERSDAEPVFVPDYRLAFVPDEVKYGAFHNCNHEVLAWLRALGCETRGTGIFSVFAVRGATSLTREEYETALIIRPDASADLHIPSSDESESESDSAGGTE